MRFAVIGLALAVAGCGGVSVEVPTLPASICAEVEPEPVGPTLSPDQLLASDVAHITALGEAVAVALIRHKDVDHPAWGRRQAARLVEARKACQ